MIAGGWRFSHLHRSEAVLGALWRSLLDLLILDRILPGTNGLISLCGLCRQRHRCPVLMLSDAMSGLKALSSVLTILPPGHSRPSADLVECKVSACFPLFPFVRSALLSQDPPVIRAIGARIRSGLPSSRPPRGTPLQAGGAVPGCCPSWIDVALAAALFICPWPARPPHDHALTLRDAMIGGTGRACS